TRRSRKSPTRRRSGSARSSRSTWRRSPPETERMAASRGRPAPGPSRTGDTGRGRSDSRARQGRPPVPRSGPAGGSSGPPPLEADSRGAWIVLALVAALCVAVTMSFRIYDPDLWQHLEVGRVLWRTHKVPHAEIWTWPRYGAPTVMPSWGFRVFLWPFWRVGGVAGLYWWRWLSALA